MSLFGGLLEGGTQNHTSTSSPWEALNPYLMGSPGTQGHYGQGAPIYGGGGPREPGNITGYEQGEWVPGTPASGGLLNDIWAQYQNSGPNANQTAGYNMATNFADSFGGTYGNILDAYNSMLSAPDVMNNPAVTGLMDANAASINQNLNQNVLPGIMQRYGSAGHVGGSSQSAIAEGLARGGASDAIANSNAGILSSAYGQGLAAQGNALSNAGNIAQLGMLPSNIYQSVGDSQANLPWQNLTQTANLFNSFGGGTQSQPVYGASPLQTLAGIGLTGYGMGLFS